MVGGGAPPSKPLALPPAAAPPPAAEGMGPDAARLRLRADGSAAPASALRGGMAQAAATRRPGRGAAQLA